MIYPKAEKPLRALAQTNGPHRDNQGPLGTIAGYRALLGCPGSLGRLRGNIGLLVMNHLKPDSLSCPRFEAPGPRMFTKGSAFGTRAFLGVLFLQRRREGEYKEPLEVRQGAWARCVLYPAAWKSLKTSKRWLLDRHRIAVASEIHQKL